MRIVTKSLLVFGVVLFLLSISSAAAAQSTGTLSGTVLDSVEKFPLPTVRITLKGTNIYGATDAEGNFTIINIPPGTYSVTFELSGYLMQEKKDVAIAAGETTELQISLKMGFSHEMTVTARREITSLQKVPQNIEVLTATEIEDSPVVNIVQALNNVTGVDVETGSGVTGVGAFMSINGYDDVYIKKMVDGVDITAVITNWSLLNAYPQEMLDQIEVVKGGASSVWGANMGGIINLVTRRPRDMERPIITLKGTYSNFGEMNFGEASAIPQSGDMLRFSGNIVGSYEKLGYMFGYKRDNHDLFTDYGSEKNYNIFAKLGYDFSDSTYLDALYSYNKIGITGHSFLESDWFAAYGFPYYWNYNDDATSSSQVASVKLNSRVMPSLNLEAQLKFDRMDGDFDRTWLEGGFINGPTGTVDKSLFMDQRLGFTAKASYNPSEAFSLVAGADYYRIKADFSNFIEDQPIIYVDQVAPFINGEYRLGPVWFNLGARYDYDSSFGSQLSPSIGANLNLFNATIIRANVGRTFKVPDLWYTLGEAYVDLILPNPDLKPERAWAYSAGFESQELEYIWVKVSLYLHKMTDGIVRVPSETVPDRFTWGNATEFTRKGYQAELGVLTPFGLSGYIATNYNDHKDESAAQVLTWIPTRTYKSRLKYENEKWDFMVNLTGRWIWWNEEGEADLMELFSPHDKVWQFDIRAAKGFDISERTRISLFLDIYNLTDKLYWDRKDAPNPRRRAELGFELKFR